MSHFSPNLPNDPDPGLQGLRASAVLRIIHHRENLFVPGDVHVVGLFRPKLTAKTGSPPRGAGRQPTAISRVVSVRRFSNRTMGNAAIHAPAVAQDERPVLISRVESWLGTGGTSDVRHRLRPRWSADGRPSPWASAKSCGPSGNRGPGGGGFRHGGARTGRFLSENPEIPSAP